MKRLIHLRVVPAKCPHSFSARRISGNSLVRKSKCNSYEHLQWFLLCLFLLQLCLFITGIVPRMFHKRAPYAYPQHAPCGVNPNKTV